VLEKKTEVGEWLNEGGQVCTIAYTKEIDFISNVPQRILEWLKKDSIIEVSINDKAYSARLNAIIPQGDVATRTFPVRLRLSPEAEGVLYEGMKGFARFPAGQAQSCLMVSRDAVLTVRGDTIVYAVENGMALVHPVKVLGYAQDLAGVESPSLKPGMKVITKGNERLRPGQPVNPSESLEPSLPGQPQREDKKSEIKQEITESEKSSSDMDEQGQETK
jgi:RND family efflux transporter MFP subunit